MTNVKEIQQPPKDEPQAVPAVTRPHVPSDATAGLGPIPDADIHGLPGGSSPDRVNPAHLEGR